MKSLLILFLFLLYPLSGFAEIDERKTDVYFANGILTDEGNATANTILLGESIKNKLYNGSETEMKKAIGKVGCSYNSTHGIAADLFESLLQKADKSSVISSVWNGFKVLIGRFIPHSDKII